jgi:hypothetical protein
VVWKVISLSIVEVTRNDQVNVIKRLATSVANKAISLQIVIHTNERIKWRILLLIIINRPHLIITRA